MHFSASRTPFLLGSLLMVLAAPAAALVWGAGARPAPAITVAAAAAQTADSAAADPGALSADKAFMDAVEKTDRGAAGKLLDADFTWTDAAGRTLSRAQLMKTLMPMPAAINEEPVEIKWYTYGAVAVVETNSGKMHTVRIWVKRPVGWRAMAYQEVRSLEAPPSVTPGAGRECSNPCRTIPFEPMTVSQRGVVSAYLALESAAVAKNAAAWGAVTSEEFVAASSNSDRLLDRRTRMAELAQADMAGLAPTPVLSAEMFDLPGAVLMKSEHQPEHGKPLHVTRLWVERNGKWLATLSYQTSIAAAEAAP
jgi:hypothetical protein